MSLIRFAERSDIDSSRWDACVAASENSMVYANSWYLDALCGVQWAGLILGDYEGVFPLPWKRKWGLRYIYQPFFCQQLGLFAKAEIGITQEDCIAAIPWFFLRIQLQLNLHFPLTLPHVSRKNYLLDLNATYAQLYDHYTADCKKNLRKCTGNGFDYIQATDPKLVIELYKSAWGSLNLQLQESHYAAFLTACKAAQQRDQLLIVIAKKGEETLGGALFLKSPKYLHYICAAPTPAGRKVAVMHGIIDAAIQQFAGSGLVLDFEGSEIQDVAAFYEKFGPRISSYASLRRRL